ncbi:MAG TPA: hypothetical protein VEN82_01645, partial [Actinomycetota bacterium]|nr:hypothetical protein [Actinomycetota bacterium]
ILREVGATGDLAYVFSERSRLALLRGSAEEALDLAELAGSYVGEDPLELARCLFLKGRALGALDRRQEATAWLREAANRFEALGARQQEASCWREVGELDLAAGDVRAAVESLRLGLLALDQRRSRA